MKRAGCGAGPNSIGRAGSSNGTLSRSNHLAANPSRISGDFRPKTLQEMAGKSALAMESLNLRMVCLGRWRPRPVPAAWPARIALIDGPF